MLICEQALKGTHKDEQLYALYDDCNDNNDANVLLYYYGHSIKRHLTFSLSGHVTEGMPTQINRAQKTFFKSLLPPNDPLTTRKLSAYNASVTP